MPDSKLSLSAKLFLFSQLINSRSAQRLYSVPPGAFDDDFAGCQKGSRQPLVVPHVFDVLREGVDRLQVGGLRHPQGLHAHLVGALQQRLHVQASTSALE